MKLLLLIPLLAQEPFKVSEKASQVVILRSSEEQTTFYVSGVMVGQGRTVPVKLEKNQKYEVKAHPAGCRAREDTIAPPYRKQQEFEFQFMLSDCAPQIVVVAPTDGGAGVQLEVAFEVQSRSPLADLAVTLNGEKLKTESAQLAAQIPPAPELGSAQSFKVRLRLRPGPNTIQLEATDEDQRTGSETLRVRADGAR
jgi:hypothetical protein